MCEFCLKHGEGNKWYLEASNYSDDLLSDVSRRKFIEKFMTDGESLRKSVTRLENFDNAPWIIRSLFSRIITHKQKKVHFGQVVPLEDIEKIFEFTNTITRVACFCRNITVGTEARYCYGISLAPKGGKFAEIFANLDSTHVGEPDTSRFESLTKEQAIAAFRDHEREGMCHTVWTFHTPFIGGICNCDRADCLALRCTIGHNIATLFRGEYVAQVNPDECSGCRQCMRVCQFGAMAYSATLKKITIDQKYCYGCGICRSVCSKNAIHLEDRSAIPAVANLW
jgi:Pyruvate/2-oxoacid:ferredoxin oxidoreductase delta subunit